MLGSRFIFNNGNTHNGLMFGPKGWSEPPKQACLHWVACCDLKLSQSMVELHSVMSIYNVETMLCSRFIFNYGNTHNGLISDQKGCSKPPKQACLHWLTACHDVKLSQSMVELHSVMSIYNVETMLASRFIFNNGNTHNGLIFDPKGWSEPPNQACQHLLAACRDVKSSKSMVQLHSVLYTYNVETMLASRFIFNNGNTHNELIFDPKGW